MSDRVRREVVVEAEPDDVWDVVTGDGWLADSVSLDLRPGGDALFRDASGERSGWVEEARAPERLAFWWSRGEEPASRVELTLLPGAEGGTRVSVVETRPLEVLDLVGIPLAGPGGPSYGPALLAVR
jgi:uncharacterized protein YndB with AHSA1/START domain